MRGRALLVALGMLLASGTASADGDRRAAERQRIVDRELAGKVAEAPLNCISSRRPQRLIIESDSVLLFRVSSGLVYRNVLQESCPGLTRSPYEPAIANHGSQICRGDIVTVADGPNASCALGEFVPYRAAAGD